MLVSVRHHLLVLKDHTIVDILYRLDNDNSYCCSYFKLVIISRITNLKRVSFSAIICSYILTNTFTIRDFISLFSKFDAEFESSTVME